MAVLPRSTASGSATAAGEIGSPRVATSTVIGMVLGILCLFILVITYQFSSCSLKGRRKGVLNQRSPRAATSTASYAPSKPTRSLLKLSCLSRKAKDTSRPTHPSSFDSEKGPFGTEKAPEPRKTTLRSLCIVFTAHLKRAFGRAEEKRSPLPTEPSRAPNLRERRALRSLYLNTRSQTKRYPSNDTESPVSPMRKRMAGLLHLDLGTPIDSPPPPFSPGGKKSRRLYQKLDDNLYSGWSNEETPGTKKPVSALVSPWSPSEYEFPYPSLSSPGWRLPGEPFTPCTPPPLYPPPPAYIPETPLRSPGCTPSSPMRREMPKTRPTSPLPSPSPTPSMLAEEIANDIDAWALLRQRQRSPTVPVEQPDDGVFVIANESEDDSATVGTGSARTSGSSWHSAGTWEACDL
ncbi:hypothetical protein C8Q79DRAFT_1012940 [Trametes meyenii]|nr:hypothetical protein C8Q79DRAFT_1012940 [Trametes meyenii]